MHEVEKYRIGHKFVANGHKLQEDNNISIPIIPKKIQVISLNEIYQVYELFE